MSKAGLPIEAIAADIARDWWCAVQRWAGAAGALVVAVLVIVFWALPEEAWRRAREWWRR